MPTATRTRTVRIDSLTPYPGNAKKHDLPTIRASLRANGQYRAIVVRERDMMILAGHGTVEAATAEGWKKIRAELIECDDDTARRIVLVDNRAPELGGFDYDDLLALLGEVPDFDGTGYTQADLDAMFADPATATPAPKLADRFGVPPFTVLDARQGPWRARRTQWLELGIRSEEGRPHNLLKMSERAQLPQPNRSRAGGISGGGAEPDFLRKKAAYERKHGVSLTHDEFVRLHEEGAPTGLKMPNRSVPASNSGNDPRFYEKKKQVERELGHEITTADFERDHYVSDGTYSSGTSIFDPVLTELLVRWFAPPGGRILDPFAGGSVRGIVAATLGAEYVGIDLSGSQIAANRAQAAEIVTSGPTPKWVEGDSATVLAGRRRKPLAGQFDLILTCPPYADLERYSDNPADLSTMSHAEFAKAYAGILAAATGVLRPNRFAAIVIGNIRRRDGSVWDLAGLTTAAMADAGLTLYNDAILVPALGSVALRAARIFTGGRKLARAHQHVLIYAKGSGKKADAELGKLADHNFGIPVDDDG